MIFKYIKGVDSKELIHTLESLEGYINRVLFENNKNISDIVTDCELYSRRIETLCRKSFNRKPEPDIEDGVNYGTWGDSILR